MSGRGSGGAAQIGKGACIAVIFTLAAVLVFALAIKLFSLPSSVITPVNQVIKFVAVFIGCFFCIRPGRAFFKGLLCGAIVALVTYFLFAVIAGSISFGWMNLLDLLFGAAAGGISALIAAAARGRN